MRQLLPLIPVLVLLTSGCTVPGGFCIPGVTCGQTVEETHDVIVIDSLQALPDNVPPGGDIRLVAVIENTADVNAEIKNVKGVHVELYDYCQGMLELNDNAVKTTDLLRGEKKQLEWKLRAKDRSHVPVKTECTLKVLARYQYATRSVTTLHLIDYAEMQRRISEGTYKEIGSYQSIGYGPLKPYITVEGTQPIPVENNRINTVLSIQIKNRGRGFLTTADGKTGATGPSLTRDMIEISALKQDKTANDIAASLTKCLEQVPPEGIRLINGESTKIMCPIENKISGNVPVESTKIVQASIGEIEDGIPKNGYWYEFRKEVKVTVEPKF